MSTQALKKILTPFEFEAYSPLIEEILQLKKQKNAVILVHNYQTPEIYHGIADFTGDSLGLSRKAADLDCERIVFCGVHFMAETAKLLNPTRKVLIPDLDAGCSLSESITVEDVRKLKAKHPGAPVVCYVNTTAAIKAESDICCTSANAAKVVNSLKTDKVIFIPDEYLGKNVARETNKEVITHPGRCMVHEQFTKDDIDAYRKQFPSIEVVAHPECHPDVVKAADYAGSTSGMIDHIRKSKSQKIMLVTECSMSDNVRSLFPEKDFQVPCTICPHMKKITLEKVLRSLKEDVFEIEIPEEIAKKARLAVERMLQI
ncbi:MAG: quinolinate synthase [Deltaproteobacteria bacterium RIFCSPLOWO2_01_44_7]|nr:MAG: quinolinate synthase [Deltaproteobacteria bacterium RIFCSPHIGHO2_01_FULL_43_49]OGQ16339.1 MAG: quinolinate synthase [Deltaproteobacteria bacterium RIFCSPHIGHO2_02_FULL_44_53]OGQ29300.1 MAG: quinolinate synthase [Deltaproteobacteria bacterium RIFCSPHIGHO2_12_FULL_44_21]OGQ32857.1 MAG: quinolinate synthase [Deltaproteobacteria bacterium RIFCSPLOWO2_01_FULL_45_74]OGQ38524.1 MAG: quinolinate synthase [Deltaproteobacteria bacterium RIFCSPLOWO2_01_44_7]OGQ41958.1 MAG: quinolinate synthase [D